MPAEQPADGYLFNLYRRYIGEPEDRTDVYVGFGLFLGGIGLAIIALLLFLWGSTYEAHSSTYYAWIQPGYTLGLLALPAMMLGIVVLLPSERRMVYTSIAGAVVTAIAAGGFVYAYPENWHFVRDVDYTVEVVATYAIGLAGLIASTGAALIAHYLDVAKRAEMVEAIEAEGEEEDEQLSDADVRDDIDEAMEDVELSWGGVQKTEHKRLSFSEDNFDEVSVDTDAAKTTRSSGVDAQVAGLKGLKGGEKKKTTSKSTVDDQTAKLKELREQQQAEELATADDDGALSPLSGVFDRLRELLGRR